eukprot:TRINITY_DN1485_c1_g1_i1.p1 TRINITY_DN1485_c1_g1~~TRINITY_DN1485_c1_g1_i1.p1  ORF type:complete len:308 (+),score=79.61 TRINITY_DN1485_c1_g1_i1:71-994(+)
MGLVESIEALVPSEVDESHYREERRDRLYEYGEEVRDGEDSSDMQRGRGIIRYHEHLSAGYGTLASQSRVVERLIEAEAVGSLHRVALGEALPHLCLRYAVQDVQLRKANPALKSRCAVDDTDLGDLSTVVIPRPIHVAGKRGARAAADAAVYWEDLHSSIAARNATPASTPTSRSSASPQADSAPPAAAYQDAYVCVADGTLYLRDLVAAAAEDTPLAGVVPCHMVAALTCVAAPSVNATHIIPWCAGTDNLTGFVCITLRSDSVALSDGSTVHCADVRRSGILVRVESMRDFMTVMKRRLATALP